MSQQAEKIHCMKVDLKGKGNMLWLLGEIMKGSMVDESFSDLFLRTVQILEEAMDVWGAYLWVRTEENILDECTLIYKQQSSEELHILKHALLPSDIGQLVSRDSFKQGNLQESILKRVKPPRSRLTIPLKQFNENEIFGILIVEHAQEEFFTDEIKIFFETLATFLLNEAHNAQVLKSVAEKSIRDPLTDTYNRRHLDRALESLAQQYGTVTVAIIDTDNFKSINDALGHIEGDIVLKGIAQLAQGMVKDYQGEVIRYGGDEFVILVPRALPEALAILEEFRKSVEYLKIAYDLTINITVTIGVCAYPEMVSQWEKLIQAADNALLKGKNKGKNRLVLANDEDMSMA